MLNLTQHNATAAQIAAGVEELDAINNAASTEDALKLIFASIK